MKQPINKKEHWVRVARALTSIALAIGCAAVALSCHDYHTLMASTFASAMYFVTGMIFPMIALDEARATEHEDD